LGAVAFTTFETGQIPHSNFDPDGARPLPCRMQKLQAGQGNQGLDAIQ
jgi:hypothetical protein